MGDRIDAIGSAAGDVAMRVRALIGEDGQAQLSGLARRLHVDLDSLRACIDDRAPRADSLVLAAIVREFGVDPSWLVSGEYNAATHHAALDEDLLASRNGLPMLIKRLTPNPTQTVRTSDIPEDL